MNDIMKSFLCGIAFGAVLLLMFLSLKAQIESDKARFNVWIETETGETYKATAFLNDNGKSIIGHSVFITCFELEYLAPALTAEIWEEK